MHALTFMYPTAPGETFDFDHYFKTHLPLGVGLARKHLEIHNKQMIIQTVRPSGNGADAPYYLLCHVLLETKEEAERLASLFEMEEPRQRLSDDWPKYTPVPPVALLSEWTVLDDMDGLNARFVAELEPHEAGAS
jgi:hypothetical protein